MTRDTLQSQPNDPRTSRRRLGGDAMPLFSGALSAEELDGIAHYVVEQIAPKA